MKHRFVVICKFIYDYGASVEDVSAIVTKTIGTHLTVNYDKILRIDVERIEDDTTG